MPLLESFLKLFARRPEIRMPRRWPRIVMTDATSLSLTGGGRASVKLANLSAGGARILSSQLLAEGDRVTLLVPLGGGARTELPAEVIYCGRDKGGLHHAGGVRFLGAGRDGVPEILAFIEEELRRRSGAGEPW